MAIAKFKPLITLLIIAIILYALHKLVFFTLLENADATFKYSLEILYVFFFISTAVIISMLIIIKKRSLDQVGMSFLLITSIKMIFCYVLLRPILLLETQNSSIEKINFFTLFILFLAIETLTTIRLLNNKQ